MKKGKVCRLMNGLEKRYDDCYSHALYLREDGPCTVVLTDDGTTLYWPSHQVVDDATEEESADFFVALNKTRSEQRSAYKEKRR